MEINYNSVCSCKITVGKQGIYVSHVYTIKSERNKGYAREMFNMLVERYKGQRIYLWAEPQHYAFYEKLGFVRQCKQFSTNDFKTLQTYVKEIE